MPDRPTSVRRGLIENAGGRLKCALCGEPVHEVGLVSVATHLAQTVVTAEVIRTIHDNSFPVEGINGVVVGMACQQGHKMWLNLIVTDRTISVVTEWEPKSDEVER